VDVQAFGQEAPVVVDGSSTVFRISRAAQLSFRKKFGDKVKVTVGNHGTGGGFGRYLQGEVDVVDASRDAKPEETGQAKEKGFDWTRYLVGYDGITVVVNPNNTWVKSLTTEQLRRLFAPSSTVSTWKDLDPSWPARKISLYSPDPDSGTFEFFVEAILKTKEKLQRKDVQVNADDNVLVTGVAGEDDGLGYFGYAYYAANKSRLRAIPVDDGKGPVLPDLNTILTKEYAPLSRPLYIFVKNAAFRRPEVAQFVTYYLDNVAELTRIGGYVPPTKEDIAANSKALAGAGRSQ
jgi:phosphate transport system substrate-binding protein